MTTANQFEKMLDKYILDAFDTLRVEGKPRTPADVALFVASEMFPEMRNIETMHEYAKREIELLARAEVLLGRKN